MLKWGKPLYVYLTPHGDIKRTREGQPQQEKFDMDPKMRLMGVYDERASFDWILEDLRYMYGM
jgi:hypothetical protein